MNSSEEETVYFLLSATRKALIGEVQVCFRGVTIEWIGNTAELFFYIDGEIAAKLHDDCTSIGAEVVAFFSEAKICEHILRIDYPKSLPNHQYWAFRRYENEKIEYIAPQEYKGLILSALYSLLGVVLPEMRGVAVESQDRSIQLIFYCNGPIEKISNQCAEICATIKKLNPDLEIKNKLIRMDYTTTLPKHDLNWIFLRKE